MRTYTITKRDYMGNYSLEVHKEGKVVTYPLLTYEEMKAKREAALTKPKA